MDRFMDEVPYPLMMEWVAFYKVQAEEMEEHRKQAELEARAKNNRGRYR